MDIEASPTYQALPEHAKSAWLKAVRALPPAWLLPPATDERFEGRDHCLKRLNGYRLYEGFVVVSGRVWKEITLRWQFLCKMHGRATANKRGLEARKAKDKEGNCYEHQPCGLDACLGIRCGLGTWGVQGFVFGSPASSSSLL
jgi:hypothetical protein